MTDDILDYIRSDKSYVPDEILVAVMAQVWEIETEGVIELLRVCASVLAFRVIGTSKTPPSFETWKQAHIDVITALLDSVKRSINPL